MKTGVGVRVVRRVSVVGAAMLLAGVLAGCRDGSPSPRAAPTETGSSAVAAPGSLRLTAPESLPGGYRAQGPAKVVTDHPSDPQPAGYKSFDGSLVAKYTDDSDGTLTIGGAWGTITDPDTVAASATAAMQSPRHTWTRPLADADARDPHDPHSSLKCGASTEAMIVMTTCLWANHYTAGSVTFTAWVDGRPAPLDQADAAERTRRIRDTMTIPT
ncbi:hypothetical protein ACFVH7_36880 [Kitasatospora indigofera]|uniref:hypothetical protein n=1 Tax=Kitasatospora indigofera TaxID=67307 RepID=UPI00363C2A32